MFNNEWRHGGTRLEVQQLNYGLFYSTEVQQLMYNELISGPDWCCTWN